VWFWLFTERELFGTPEVTVVNFLFVVLDEGGCLRKVDTGDELLACILDAAARMKKREH
jgi:hypothetical protein